MKYTTLGVIASALFLLGTGQKPFVPPAAAAQAAAKPAAKPAAKAVMSPAVKNYLKQLREDRNPYARANAAKQLGVLLVAPTPLVPEVLEQLHQTLISDTSTQVRIMAANAIARINQPSSVDRLMKAIQVNRGRTDAQLAIIRALGDLRKASLGTVPVLVRFLHSPSPYVREATVEALWKIRPSDPRVAHVLNQLLAEEEELVVKLTLTNVIADFKSKESVPILQKIVKNAGEHVDVKALAYGSLEKLAEWGLAPPPTVSTAPGGGH